MLAALLWASPGCGNPNPISTENALPGDSGRWTRTSPADFSPYIEGYASEVSVKPGETLQLHIRTQAPGRYRVEISRLGWYGGKGGRRVACIPACNQDEAAVSQPAPPAPDPSTGKLNAGWSVTDSVPVGNWTSGYYLAELLFTTGPHAGSSSYVPFFVTAPKSDILVVAPVNTWEAYNGWGGKSLYPYNSTGKLAATHVSFNRPYGNGVGIWSWEYQLVRFLEREGYDVSYATDVDLHRDPSILLNHKLVMVAGHSEYWSAETFQAYVAARDAGVNLAFMGGNDAYWQVRYEDAERTIVEYRNKALDPQTDHFRALGKPACELLGIEDEGGIRASRVPSPYTVATETGWFQGTTLHTGEVLPGLVGYEWDRRIPNCNVPPLTEQFSYVGSPSNADSIRYRARSGAFVFAAGSIQFSWALDGYQGGDRSHTEPPVPGVQQFVRNMLSEALSATR